MASSSGNAIELIPVRFPLIKEGDDIAAILLEQGVLQDGDIVAISSKIVSHAEGSLIALENIVVSTEAEQWVQKLGRTIDDARFREAVLQEAARMNGEIISDCEHAMLAELRPDGLTEGSILAANAGLDKSNTPEGYALGWPKDPVESGKQLHKALLEHHKDIGVLITDSCCRPRRLGVTAITLTAFGFNPLPSHIGEADLYGRELRMTQEALADQLATASNMLMGNTSERIPVVLIRNSGIPPTDFAGWVPGIEPKEDLFCGMFNA